MIPYTQLPSTNRQNLMDILPLKKPFTLLIEPSSLCNFKCVQCFQSLKEDNYFSRQRCNMPMAIYEKVIYQMKEWNSEKLKVLKLSLYGEPLLNPDFCEMLRIASEANIAERIETTTNASLLTEKISEKLVEYQLDYIRVSIYSANQHRHEEITGTKFDIKNIHKNLMRLQEIKKNIGSNRPFVALKMLDTYGPENDAFFNMYTDVADEMYIDKPHNWIKSSKGKFTDFLYKGNFALANEDMRKDLIPRRACPMAFTTMAVRSNGDIAPCCIDFIGGTNLGKINEINLRELWNSDVWLKFLTMQLEGRKHENHSCTHCDFYMSDYYTKDNIDDFDVKKLRNRRNDNKER
ncbi:MAG: radical SAM protein [Parabacteroides sp.]|nr:radical SAM protein [Parabacteroides sp.]